MEYNVLTERRKVEGAFACVCMIAGFGVIAFRDTFGIRPLILGRRTIDGEHDYITSSESVALKHLGSTLREMRDILPGEVSKTATSYPYSAFC